MKTEWKEFARDMEQLEADLEALADTMPADEQMSYSHSTYTRNGKTVHRQSGRPQYEETVRPTVREYDRSNLQEWVEMRMERMIQQRTNMLYVLVCISMLLSFLALVVACLV